MPSKLPRSVYSLVHYERLGKPDERFAFYDLTPPGSAPDGQPVSGLMTSPPEPYCAGKKGNPGTRH